VTDRPITLDARGLEFQYRQKGSGSVNGHGFHLGPVSFQLSAHEFLAIIGPNGSGKSTLLSLLGGLMLPAVGRVQFNGADLGFLPPRDRARRVAYVRQETNLVFPIRVEQFVMLGRFPYTGQLGFDSTRDREMTQWALEATSLQKLSSRRMDEISGGERQRAILARALTQEPELLLLDEPTASLDVNFQIEMLRLVRRMAEDHGFTVVAVMHELNLASEFADSLLLMKNGRCCRFGPPEHVLQHDLVEEAYGVPVHVDRNPYSGRPRVTVAASRL